MADFIPFLAIRAQPATKIINSQSIVSLDSELALGQCENHGQWQAKAKNVEAQGTARGATTSGRGKTVSAAITCRSIVA